MTMSQATVLKLYNSVVDDVIAGVRDCFLDDGVDEQVLQELKQLWMTKLTASGAMDAPQLEPSLPPPPVLQNFQKTNGNAHKRAAPSDSQIAQQSSSSSGDHGPATHNLAGMHPHQTLDPSNRVPVQLTLPAQPGVPGSQPRSFTIQIPASALNGNKLHQVLTGPIINATLSLPQPLAATLLQQHINSALAGQQNEFDGGGGGRSGAAPIFSLDGAMDSSDDEDSNVGDGPEEEELAVKQPVAAMLLQQRINSALAEQKNKLDSGGGSRSGATPIFSLDGAMDSSDDEGSNIGDGSDNAADDDEDEESAEERAEEEEEERDESGGIDEEPLNSEDDVSDQEPGDMFDTDNVVVCQYDKITRSRNRWKFYLKDGIMNLTGKDYVFQKANGDAEW